MLHVGLEAQLFPPAQGVVLGNHDALLLLARCKVKCVLRCWRLSANALRCPSQGIASVVAGFVEALCSTLHVFMGFAPLGMLVRPPLAIRLLKGQCEHGWERCLLCRRAYTNIFR